MGMNGGSLALVVYERVVKIDSAAASKPDEANKPPLKNTKRGGEDEPKTKSTVEEWVSLNERIIKDGMGEWYDETRECTVRYIALYFIINKPLFDELVFPFLCVYVSDANI